MKAASCGKHANCFEIDGRVAVDTAMSDDGATPLQPLLAASMAAVISKVFVQYFIINAIA